MSDITYRATGEGWLYLASRKISVPEDIVLAVRGLDAPDLVLVAGPGGGAASSADRGSALFGSRESVCGRSLPGPADHLCDDGQYEAKEERLGPCVHRFLA